MYTYIDMKARFFCVGALTLFCHPIYFKSPTLLHRVMTNDEKEMRKAGTKGWMMKAWESEWSDGWWMMGWGDGEVVGTAREWKARECRLY